MKRHLAFINDQFYTSSYNGLGRRPYQMGIFLRHSMVILNLSWPRGSRQAK